MILKRHLATDRLLLLGHVDDAHAALADLLEELVRADSHTGAFEDRGMRDRDRARRHRPLHEIPGARHGAQQILDFRAERRVGRA